jgi:hypothetical protein
MASELRVNTLKDASGNNSIATSFVAQGSAKMWVQHNAGTSILDSNNVASLTDSGTGDYNVTYTSAMASTQYTCAGSWGNDGNGVFVADSLTASLVGTRYKTLGSGGSAGDCATANCSVHGDLA